jgi:LysM repeat protein
LTRRGRVASLVGLLVLGTVLVVLAGGPGQAADSPSPFPTAVVESGDTLWSVAARAAPGRDRFQIIDEIRRLNGLPDYTVHPGQRLILPRTR